METMQPTPSLTRGRFWLQLHPCTQTPQLTGSDTQFFVFFFLMDAWYHLLGLSILTKLGFLAAVPLTRR